MKASTESFFESLLPTTYKNTLLLKAFAFTKIPVLFFLNPSVEELTDVRCVVKIPFNRRSKNHVGSMYFAALAAGADIAAGFLAMAKMREMKKHFSFIFKDFKADFLKRAEGDTLFTCDDGEMILKFVEEARRTGERVNFPVNVTATVPSQFGGEPVAKFVLTCSIKAK